jgi:hypothetical protein
LEVSEDSAEAAKARALQAKAREIEAHRRAITLHEDAAILFDRLHQSGRSRDARERAERAREMLRLALEEQAEAARPSRPPVGFEQDVSFSALAPGRAGVEQYVREYLSVQHRDNPDDGCPSAALLDEIGRSTDATKQAYTDGVLVIVDDIAARLAPDDPQSARVKTLSVFAMMVGTLQLSRALADQQLADQVLEEGIQNALVLLGAEHQT